MAAQAETAIRHLAFSYTYDSGEYLVMGETSLRPGVDDVALALKTELETTLPPRASRCWTPNSPT